MGIPIDLDNNTLAESPLAWLLGSCGSAADRELELAIQAAGWLAEPVDADEAVELADPEFPPAAVLLCHERPTQRHGNLTTQLRTLLPETPMLMVGGSWSEGTRARPSTTGGIAWRPWHEATGWLEGITPSDDGSIAPGNRPLVVTEAADFESADTVAAALHAEGFATALSTPPCPANLTRGADAAVWVGGQLDGLRANRLATFCQRHRRCAMVVALLDFPRPDEAWLARQLGATAVLGKPWSPRALAGILRRATGESRSQPQRGGLRTHDNTERPDAAA
ncbi:MAG: hypothetical protein AAGJ46_03080 [Planctomycetota bacterium]